MWSHLVVAVVDGKHKHAWKQLAQRDRGKRRGIYAADVQVRFAGKQHRG